MSDETMTTGAEARARFLEAELAEVRATCANHYTARLELEAALKASEARVESAYRDGWEDSERAECFDRVEDYLTAYLAALSPEEGGRVAAAAEAHNAEAREQGRREGLLDAANRLNANPPQPHTSDETPAFYAGFDCGVEAAGDVLHSLVADTDERDDPDDLAAGSQEPRE